MMFNSITLVNALLCLSTLAQGKRKIKHALSLPSISTDFPDPAIIQVGDTWWAFATNSNGSNIQLASSPSFGFDGKWQRHIGRDVLPKLPEWVSKTRSDVWAPSVVQTVSVQQPSSQEKSMLISFAQGTKQLRNVLCGNVRQATKIPLSGYCNLSHNRWNIHTLPRNILLQPRLGRRNRYIRVLRPGDKETIRYLQGRWQFTGFRRFVRKRFLVQKKYTPGSSRSGPRWYPKDRFHDKITRS